MVIETKCPQDLCELLAKAGMEIEKLHFDDTDIYTDGHVYDLYNCTQAQAMQWLRDEKGIFVTPSVYPGRPVQFGYGISMLSGGSLVYKGCALEYSTYEEATESGLRNALQILFKAKRYEAVPGADLDAAEGP
jgi:hypothetical protein